jgi:hypothetical protein
MDQEYVVYIHMEFAIYILPIPTGTNPQRTSRHEGEEGKSSGAQRWELVGKERT